jgi:undecaprenyl-diphosphatase
MIHYQQIDLNILLYMQSHFRNATFDYIFPLITDIGELGLCWIVICIGLLFSKKYRRVGFLTLVALAFGGIIGDIIIKHIVQRPRPFMAWPDISLLIKAPPTYSFPSGHALSSFAAATVLSFYLKYWRIPLFLLAFLIAFSRLYLFVHYPSDVLAGALLGIAIGCLVIYFAPPKKELLRE